MPESIFIEIDDARVEGEILHRSRADIEVRIVAPYRGIATGMHIPYFAMANPDNDYRKPHGDRTAARLLEDLYRFGKHVEDNREQLSVRLAELDAAIENLDPNRFPPEGAFLAIRRGLRAQMRNGSIDSKEYQRRLGRARKRARDRSTEIRRLESDFFRSHFPLHAPVWTRDEVRTLLRSFARC